ncbi:tetratricopeptide repeat protein [Streptomyces sp. NPDC055287]
MWHSALFWLITTAGTLVVGGAVTLLQNRLVRALSGMFRRADEAYYVPLAVRNNLIAEDQQIAAIRKAVLARRREHRGVCVLVGMPGVGKSQASAQYAHRYRGKYRIVWWVTATTPEDLVASFIELANALRLVEPERQRTQLAIANDLKQWLENKRRWLVIFDNANHSDLLFSLLPRTTRRNHVLLSSNDPIWEEYQDSVLEVDVPSIQASSAYLVDRTGRRNELDSARLVATELGCLPLALEQAASYIQATRLEFSEYLTYLQESPRIILERSGLLRTNRFGVLRAVDAAIEGAASITGASSAILESACYLDHAAIPVPLLREATGLGGLEFNEGLAALRRYSLASTNTTGDTLSVHYLVQALVRESVGSERSEQTLRALLRVINDRFPDRPWDISARAEAAPLFSHVLSVVRQGRRLGFTDVLLADSAHACGRFVWSIGEMHVCLPLFEAASEIYRALGQQVDPALLPAALNDLSIAWTELGSPRTALRLHVQAYRLSRDAFGPQDRSVAWALTGIGDVLRDLGRSGAAVRYFQEALRVYDGLRPAHHDIVWTQSGYGNALADLGRLDEAEELHTAALESRLERFGEPHPEVARSYHSMGRLHSLRNSLTDARNSYAKAVDIRTRTLGTVHPHTARSWAGLASVLEQLGDRRRAGGLYQQAAAVERAALGPAHPRLCHTLAGAGRCAEVTGDRATAHHHYVRALECASATSGAVPPSLVAGLEHAVSRTAAPAGPAVR